MSNGTEAGGRVRGVAVALVRSNRDDEGLGRVKVAYPWSDHPHESYWARVAVPMAGAGRGTYFIPEVGDEVLVAFERDDLRFPYVVGSLWNSKDRPPVSDADGTNDIRVIRTRKGHKLTFDDGIVGKVELELNDGKRVTVDDDGIVLADNGGNAIRIASGSGEIRIEATTRITLNANEIVLDGGTVEVRGVLLQRT
jgi:uncharacterized protein involved in type VI secretion and phage assembly